MKGADVINVLVGTTPKQRHAMNQMLAHPVRLVVIVGIEFVGFAVWIWFTTPGGSLEKIARLAALTAVFASV